MRYVGINEVSLGGFRLFRHVFEEAVRENAKNKERYVMEKLGFFRINRTGNQRWVKTYGVRKVD